MSGTYNPDFYDLAIAGTFHGDIEWFCRKARKYGGPVLELGAGTGRITLPVAQEGLSVHALDAHPGMLDALRRKTSALPREVRELITITEGDMRRFRLDRTFSFVIIPFRAFLQNLTTDDQLACLQTTTRTELSREPSSITWSCRISTHPTSGSCWSAVVSMPSKSPVTSTVARSRKTPTNWWLKRDVRNG